MGGEERDFFDTGRVYPGSRGSNQLEDISGRDSCEAIYHE